MGTCSNLDSNCNRYFDFIVCDCDLFTQMNKLLRIIFFLLLPLAAIGMVMVFDLILTGVGW